MHLKGNRAWRWALTMFVVGFTCSLAEPAAAWWDDEPSSTAAANSDDDSASSETSSDVPPIVPDETESFVEKIDGAFESAVNAMGKVLFYRIGASERKFVTYNRREFYIRDRGSKGDFQQLDPDGAYDKTSLSSDDLTLLAAKGRLVPGKNGDLFRPGLLGEKPNQKPVDYVTVTFEVPRQDGEGIPFGAKYVWDPEKKRYRRVQKKRGLLSEADTLSESQVKQHAVKGWLKADADSAVDKKTPWLITEPVGGAPVVVVWLALGAVFFTIYMRGFNIWGFRHALDIVRGKYDNPDETGEVTHFQALASALSATVGLGNIAGVTIAMTLGGPGAFFWMIFCGLFGMTSKFTECTLGQKYRTVKPDGTVLGGPMRYLSAGLAELKIKPLGVALSVLFAVMCVLASFGGGNMFQANQSGSAMVGQLQRSHIDELGEINKKIKQAAEKDNVADLKSLQIERGKLQGKISTMETSFRVGYGLVLAIMVAIVIIGGIRRIGKAAEKIVPTMCLIYCGACLWIICSHLPEIPALVASIFTEAFSGKAMGGGLVGVAVVGIQRAAFSNEAGVGSAAIAHSAAKTEEPIREGCVALLGPFIDTIVVCSMTALVILITNAWNNDTWLVDEGLEGAQLTSRAFGAEISWFPWVLSVAVVLFAYSTIISWSYYGERCWEQLFGPRSTIVYKVLAVTCVFIGAIVNLGAVLDFSDMMILSMAFPNVLGVVLLSPKIKRDLAEYWKRYKSGEFRTFK